MQPRARALQDLVELYRGIARLLEPAQKRSLLLVSLWAGGLSLLELVVAGSVMPYMACLTGNACGPPQALKDWLGVDPLMAFSLLLILLVTLKIAVEIGLAWRLAGFHQDVQRRTVTRLLRAYLAQSWPAYRDRHRADYHRRCTVTAVDAAYACRQCVSMLASAMVVLVLGALLLWVNPLVSMLLAGIFLLVSAAAQGLTGRLQAAAAQRREDALHTWLTGMAEALDAFRELRVYRAERYFLGTVESGTGALGDANRRLTFLPVLPRLALDYLAFILVLLAVLFWLTLERPLADLLPYFVFYAVVARSILPAMTNLLGMRSTLHGMVINIHLVLEDLDQARRRQTEPPSIPAARGAPALVLSNLGFRHGDGTAPLLRDVSLRIARPAWIALTGSSGSGKSTLLEILCGLREPTEGSVQWLDDPPAGQAPRPPLTAYVPQHVALLDASVLDNVVFGFDAGREGAVRAALRAAQLEPLVERLPRGLYEPVGADGARLSGGERQRLAIARAIYRCPELLLLDEATAALDEAVEAALLQALRRALPETTVIFVTHRRASLRFADRALNLEDARLEAMPA